MKLVVIICMNSMCRSDYMKYVNSSQERNLTEYT